MIEKLFQLAFFLVLFGACSKNQLPRDAKAVVSENDSPLKKVAYSLPQINLDHWKVTLPIGKPTEIKAPEIVDYASNDLLKDFMFNDSIEGALVFYTYPGATTSNSSYSRTELREQMTPGSNQDNWTFAQGGRLKGTLRLADISTDAAGDPHRTIIMQIHGRLSDEQRDLIGAKDHNAPPVLKVYWEKGRIKVKTKELRDVKASPEKMLYTNAWKDDKGFFFTTRVDQEKFTLEIIASKGRLEVILNDKESKVFENVHMEKWGIFENYFKAGNYLQTKEDGAFASVKYYALEVSH